MKHFMKLQSRPFEAIANGSKTIELRLFDEKRQQVKIGDEIEFTELSGSKRTLLTKVVALHRFSNFEELYKSLPLEKCGYDVETVKDAKSTDMDAYYSPEEQKLYGVIGIEIDLI